MPAAMDATAVATMTVLVFEVVFEELGEVAVHIVCLLCVVCTK